MKKLWKVLATIAVAALVAGILLLAVGMLTGADFSRVLSVLDARYHVIMYFEWVQDVIDAVAAQL